MQYNEHPLENLTPEQLDEVAAYTHPFTEGNLKNISARFEQKVAAEKPRGKSRKKWMAVLVAAAAVALVGFTNADRIQQLFASVFGINPSFSRYAETVQKSSEDQGIRMEVLTALSDGGNTYLFVELEDRIGSRLSEDLFVDNWDLVGEGNIGGGNCRLADYDPAAGIATLAVHAIGAKPGNEAVFSLKSFFTDEVQFDFTAADLDLAQLLKEREGSFVQRDRSGGSGGGYGQEFIDAGLDFDDITAVLAPDSLHIGVSGYDKGVLSGIGYRDGLLHIQMNPDNNRGNEALMLSLIHRKTGEEAPSFYSINYGAYSQGGMAYSNDYQEWVFQIPREDIGDYALHLKGWYYNTVVDGDWAVRFQVPEQKSAVQVPAGKTVAVGGENCTVTEMTVSPLSVEMNLQGDAEGEIQVVLVDRDGTKSVLESEMKIHLVDGEEHTVKISGSILHFDTLSAVEINGTAFPLPEPGR